MLGTGKAVTWCPEIRWTWCCQITCKAIGHCLESRIASFYFVTINVAALLETLSKEHVEVKAIFKFIVPCTCLQRVCEHTKTLGAKYPPKRPKTELVPKFIYKSGY